jgi:hypothetical protein
MVTGSCALVYIIIITAQQTVLQNQKNLVGGPVPKKKRVKFITGCELVD